MENNVAVFRPPTEGETEYKFGVVRTRYSPKPFGVKDRRIKTYQAINEFNLDTMKENWYEYYTDLENWKYCNPDSRIAQFVKIFNILYDGDLYVNATCTNDRCDGYDTEFDEWYFENEKEIFSKLIEVFGF